MSDPVICASFLVKRNELLLLSLIGTIAYFNKVLPWWRKIASVESGARPSSHCLAQTAAPYTNFQYCGAAR